MTPIAVTAAPAPAPWTTNGRAPYLSVWNMIMLSEPPSAVANGCVTGYLQKFVSRLHLRTVTRATHLSRSALITPVWTSTTPA